MDATTIEKELIKNQTFDELIAFAKNGDVKKMEGLFKQRKETIKKVFAWRDKDDKTIWHHSCQHGNVTLLKLLFNTGTKEECKRCLNMASSERKRLPFHYACLSNHVSVVRYFHQLSQSDEFGDIIDLDVVNGYDGSGLDIAVKAGYREVIRILLDEEKVNQSTKRLFSQHCYYFLLFILFRKITLLIVIRYFF